MPEKSLYQDSQIRIDQHFRNSIDDHILFIKEAAGHERSYLLDRGFLQDIARLPRGRHVEAVIRNIHPGLRLILNQEGITVDGLHLAICQAYHEQEERARELVSQR